jgi:drug/metabolite transporter (DMT)-like permease
MEDSVWFLLSLMCAISLSASDFLSKIALREADIYLVSWVKVSLAFLFLFIGVFFIPIPSLGLHFLKISLILFPLEVLSHLLYMKAIQVSPLSLTVPFLALSPVFIIVTSYFMLSETLNVSGIFGILLIAIGSYMLNIDQAIYGFWGPIKAVFKEKGSWIMIIVASIFSITSNLGKMAIQATNPIFFAIFYSGIMTLLLMPFTMILSKSPIKKLKEHMGIFIGIGVFMALMALFHMMAIIRIEVAYMISIKRTSPIFSVLLGCWLLHEKNFSERFMGTIIMFLGVLLIIL